MDPSTPLEIITIRKKQDSSIIKDNSAIPEEFRGNKTETIDQKENLCTGIISYFQIILKDLNSLLLFFIVNPYLLCFIVVTLWVSCGIVFYQYHDRWTTATAFYYAIEAGLSIGFCYPAEIDDKSRVYTIFYVMIASSFVSGTVGIFLTHLFRQNIHLVPAEHGINAIKIRNQHDEITVESVARYVWYHLKYLIGWYHNRFLTIMTLLFVFWMAIGTAYGVYKEGYTFITGLYWAVTSCATGGLQTAPCLGPGTDDGTTCNMGDLRGSVMGVYFLIGVPIYAITIAQYARLVFGPLAVERELRLMDRPIEDSQFLYAANVLSPEGSETLVMGEYIILELLRLGLVDQARIEQFKQKFYELDVHNKGELEFSDLHAIGKIVPRKIHSVDVARRIRNRSLEFLYRNLSSPAKPSQSNDGNGSATRIPRVNSAREFFLSLSGRGSASKPEREDSTILIQLPPKHRKATKKAFRKSIRRSITETVDEIPTLIRDRANASSMDKRGKSRGESIRMEGKEKENNDITNERLHLFASEASPIPVGGGSDVRSKNARYRELMNSLFEDFDYNKDADEIGDQILFKEKSDLERQLESSLEEEDVESRPNPIELRQGSRSNLRGMFGSFHEESELEEEKGNKKNGYKLAEPMRPPRSPYIRASYDVGSNEDEDIPPPYNFQKVTSLDI
eukprot:gene158-165_t